MNSNLHYSETGRSWTSRFYNTEDDLQTMQGLLMEARSRTGDWHYWHVGDLTWGFFMVLCHLNPQEYIRLWHDEGRLVGYAILGEDPSFDCQVLPEYEGLGIETEALTWAETHLAELRQQDAKRWSRKLVSGTHQDDVKRIEFLERHGFQRGDYAEVNMLCSLNVPISSSESTLPIGYEVRTVADDEISNRAGAQREVWHPWSVSKFSDADYAGFMRLPSYQRDLDVVAVAPDGVIGAYANGWVDPVNRIGDFGPVGAREAYRRQGLTHAVLLEGLRRMQVQGMNRACVSTHATNVAAIRLYETVGFRIVNKYLEYVKVE